MEKQTAATRSTTGAQAGKGDDPKLKVLPSDRVQFDTQMAILRAYTAACESSGKPVTNGDVAKIIDLNTSSVSICNSFFVDAGLIERTATGSVPSEHVKAYTRAYKWSKDVAGHKLAPLIKSTWFCSALTGKLGFREMKEDEAVHDLADAASAPPEHRDRLVMLLDFLATSGLIIRENGVIKLGKPVDGDVKTHQDIARQSGIPETPKPPQPLPPAPPSLPPIADGMTLNMSLNVPMAQLSRWGKPERIKEFFDEWAKLMAAKIAIEQMLKDDGSSE